MIYSCRLYIERKISLLFLFLAPSFVWAQDPVYRTINNLNGLPSNTVYNLLQDKRGFIWVAHDKGLSRYDGKTFAQYMANTQQGRSLSNLVEANGTIWCQDFTGNIFYTKEEALLKETRIDQTGVYARAGIIKQHLLVSSKLDSICIFNIEKGKSTSFKGAKGLAVYYEENGFAYLENNKLLYSDGVTNTMLAPFPADGKDIFFLQKFGDEYYGFSKYKFPYVWHLKDDKLLSLPLLHPGLFIQDINVIDDQLWISTSSGAWCFDREMRPAFNGHCFFTGKSISKIIKDREGSYWFGTLNNGVLFVPDINSRLYKYEEEGITALFPNPGGQEVFAGTANNRLLSFNEQTFSFSSLYKEPANHEVISIMMDAQKDKLLFTSDRIVYLEGKQKTKESPIAAKGFTIINDDLYAIAYSGGLMLMGRNGVAEPAIPAWLLQKGKGWENGQYFLPDMITRGRWVDFDATHSVLYGATAAGLYYYSPGGSGKITWKGKDIYASQIISDSAAVFISTYTDGLFRVNQDLTASPVTGKGNDISKTIYKLFKSGNWVWLLGEIGLQKYNIATGEVVNYTIADGLPRAEMKDICLLNNNVYIATTDGLVVFNEHSRYQNKVPPLLVIDHLLVDGKEKDWTQQLSLRNRENSLEIDFSLLSYRNEDSLRVEYRINDGAWQRIASGTRTLNLPSLSSGKYTIGIRGFNEDGVQTETPVEISFAIAAPFYKQWWFLIGVLLLGMSLVYIYFKWRLRSEKKRNELLSQKNQLEQELQQSLLSSIKSQMNPHFLFNSLNTIQSYIYMNDKENASQYLGKFSELTRMILDMSNKDIVPLSEEIRALNLYLELEKLRFEDKLTYEFSIDESISTETTYIHSMLIQPYVENAIKHGLLHLKQPWRLSINFKRTDSGIRVTVDDNGIGRKRSEELNQLKFRKHQSFASSANQKRLEILNKGSGEMISLEIIDKKDEHGNATGTTVIMHIPFVKKS